MSDRCTSHLQLTIKSLMPTVHWRQSFYFMRWAKVWCFENWSWGWGEKESMKINSHFPCVFISFFCFSPFCLLVLSLFPCPLSLLSHNLLDDLKRHFAIFSNLLSNSFDFHYNIARTAVLGCHWSCCCCSMRAYIVGSFTMHWLITITLDV